MKYLFTFLLFTLVTSTEAQVRVTGNSVFLEQIRFYKTTDDFLNKIPTAEDKLILLKSKQAKEFVRDSLQSSLSVIMADKVVDDNVSLDKFREGERSWMLEYNGNFFLNLGYSQDVNSWGDWAKLDIVGKYCLIFIKPKSYLEKQIGKGYGGAGGLAGALTKESFKWGKNLENTKNERMKILFINTSNQSNPFLSRYKGSIANILTKRDLRNLAELHSIDFNEKDASFEEVVDLIEKINAL